MNNSEQQIWMRLQKQRLYVQRIGKHGNRIGSRTEWTIGKKSALPRELFFKIRGFVQRIIKRCGTESADELRIAVRRALTQAAETCGCESKQGQAKADMYWKLGDRLLIAWQLHDNALDVQRIKKLKTSRALLRIVVIVKKSGYFRIVPQDTRQHS
jgi:hypothetical protein